ncbi:MAG: hypothetical protein QOJ45_2776 [Verrucomicrobiota bacterium]|jgi:hypothetical protein
MKNLAPTILFAFAWAIAANSSSLEAAEYKPGTRDQPEKKFVVKPDGLLSFDADLAHGQVETGDFESVRVQFMSYFKVETEQEVEDLQNKLSIEMSQTGNTVKVTVKFADQNQANRDKIRLNFKVAIPRKFNLEMRTGGSARIADVDGAVKASTEGGSLTMENVSGSLTASSKGGSLTIKNVGGDLEARCEGGSATIGKVGGRVVATTEGGSLSIKEAAAITATATGGSVTAYLPKSPGSDCKITANGGGIDLRLGESVAVTIDAACTAGSVMSDFKIAAKKGSTNSNQLKGDMNGGGPVLTLRATAGSIHLNK